MFRCLFLWLFYVSLSPLPPPLPRPPPLQRTKQEESRKNKEIREKQEKTKHNNMIYTKLSRFLEFMANHTNRLPLKIECHRESVTPSPCTVCWDTSLAIGQHKNHVLVVLIVPLATGWRVKAGRALVWLAEMLIEFCN